MKFVGVFEWQKAVRDDRSLSSTQRLVALMLSLHMTAKTGESAHPGATLLRDETGLHIRTVRSTLMELVALGWLKLVREGRSPRGGPRVASEYAAALPAAPGISDAQLPGISDAQLPGVQGAQSDRESEATGSPECSDRESWMHGLGVSDHPRSVGGQQVPQGQARNDASEPSFIDAVVLSIVEHRTAGANGIRDHAAFRRKVESDVTPLRAEIARLHAMFPTAPIDVVASAAQGHKDSLRYHRRIS